MSASVFAMFSWLFFDALAIRVEIKSLLRTVGYLLLSFAFILHLIPAFADLAQNQLTFYLQGLGFLLLFAAGIFDSHSKLQFLTIIAIISLIFLKGHLLLALQALLISIIIMQTAYFTKHRDYIPLAIGFFLITIGEFFYSKEAQALGITKIAGDFLYMFASIILFYWLWQYLVIRFDLKRKLL